MCRARRPLLTPKWLRHVTGGFAPVGALGIQVGQPSGIGVINRTSFLRFLDSGSEQKLVCSAGYPAQPQAPEAEIALDGSAFSEINFAP
jgi:hypothetical protein